MIKELKYVNGDLLTNHNNCFEMTFTIDQAIENRYDDYNTMYFYSIDYCYHIHYIIELGKVSVIYSGNNDILRKALDYYYDEYTIKDLQHRLDDCMDYDKNIRDILTLMDDFSITIKEIKESEKK